MKISIASKLQCPNQATYELVEALKKDEVDKVREALKVVNAQTCVIGTELYDQIEPKVRTFRLSLLQVATLFMAEKSIKELLTHDIDVNFEDATVQGCQGHGPALLVLCRTLQPEDQHKGHGILQLLLDSKANPNIRDIVGTPLTYRVSAGDCESVRLLLGAQAQPNVVMLCRRFDTQRIEKHILLRAVVHDIEARRGKDDAAIAARVVILRALLGAGADPTLCSLEMPNQGVFQEESALKVVKDQKLRTLLLQSKTKNE